MLLVLIIGVWAGSPIDNSGEYYLLETEWKPTVCKFMQCPANYAGSSFNLHGLWPQRTNGSYPTHCNRDSFFIISSSLRAVMSLYMNSYTGNNQAFWEHQWYKHGTCTALKSPEAYFSSTVDLLHSVDPLRRLTASGIYPSSSSSYPVSSVYKAFPTTVKVSCRCRNNLCYLQTLQMCFDTSLNPMDCPNSRSNCGSHLMFPS